MTNKQTQSLVKQNSNLCEINREYPLFKHSSSSRHLYTGEISVKLSEHNNIEKLVKQITTEHLTKDSNKHSKEQTEMIDLFQFKQEEELKKKLYKKSRYQRRADSDDVNERDNTN